MGKADFRTAALARRDMLTTAEKQQAAEAIAAHVLAQPALRSARRVAAYVSMASEPGTGPLLQGLLDRGVEVIVPISLPDHTLDWVVHEPDATGTVSALGITEPDGPRLGSDALNSADLLIVPALAVDHAGNRLGRGAGYYDRALEHSTALRCALLFAGEIVEALPHDDFDVPVHMAITPTGVFRVP